MECPGFSVLRYGFYDSRQPFPDDRPITPRMVAYYEIEFYVTDQPGRVTLNGLSHPLMGGSFLCAKPGQLRQTKLPFQCFFVHLQTQDEALRTLLDALPDCSTLWNTQEVSALFQQLPLLDPGAPLLLGSHVLKLLHLLNRYHLPAPDRTQPQVLLHANQLLALETYIRDHLADDLSLKTLANLCSLNPNYFHRLFKAAFRRTPAEFVLTWRMTAAKSELAAGDRSPAEIAARCGFSSQNYFCYLFKKRTGMTPLEYRRAALAERTP